MSDSQLTLALSMELDEKANVYDILGSPKKAKLKFSSDEYNTTATGSVSGLVTTHNPQGVGIVNRYRAMYFLKLGNDFYYVSTNMASSDTVSLYKKVGNNFNCVLSPQTGIFSGSYAGYCWVYNGYIYFLGNPGTNYTNLYRWNGSTMTDLGGPSYDHGIFDRRGIIRRFNGGYICSSYNGRSDGIQYYKLTDGGKTRKENSIFMPKVSRTVEPDMWGFDCVMNNKIYSWYEYTRTDNYRALCYGRFSISGTFEAKMYELGVNGVDNLIGYNKCSRRFEYRNSQYYLQQGNGLDLYKDNLNGTFTKIGASGLQISTSVGDPSMFTIDALECDNILYIAGAGIYDGSSTYRVSGMAKLTYYGDLIPANKSSSAVNSCAAVLNNKIYIFGGNYAHELLYQDLSNGTTARLTGIPFAVNKGVALNYGDGIHIIYGTSHYKFDGTNFTQQANCPVSLTSKAATVFNGAIHVVQGKSHRSFSNGSWTTVSTVPANVTLGALAVVNNELHLIANTNLHYVYRNGSWVSLGTTPTSIVNASVVVANNIIYIIGGTENPQAIYSYENGNWGAKANVPYDHLQGASLYHDGALYIIGGTATDSIVKLAPGSSISTVITFNMAKMRELGII